MRHFLFVACASLALSPFAAPICVTHALAASVSGTLTIVVAPQVLAMMINPSTVNEACEVAAGTVVSALSTVGGDGNPVTFSLAPAPGAPGGAAADFVVAGSNVVVGPNGIAAADCNATEAYTVGASQQ
jgi:hypothetical protein